MPHPKWALGILQKPNLYLDVALSCSSPLDNQLKNLNYVVQSHMDFGHADWKSGKGSGRPPLNTSYGLPG